MERVRDGRTISKFFERETTQKLAVKWGKKKLLDLCEKHLAKVTEPALKISKELVTVTNAFEEWMHAVGKKNANKTFVEVAKQDENELLSSSSGGLSSKDKATEILNELRACEREATEHIEYIKNNLDPFKVMQYPVHGCSILDLSYVHVDFSNRDDRLVSIYESMPRTARKQEVSFTI